MTKPTTAARLTRILNADTGVGRLVIAVGLLIVGGAMLAGGGSSTQGAELMARAMPIWAWGVLCVTVGAVELYGVFGRIAYEARLLLCLSGAWLWMVIALSENAHMPTPTRLLLVLPAVVELWVLIKVALLGRREN